MLPPWGFSALVFMGWKGNGGFCEGKGPFQFLFLTDFLTIWTKLGGAKGGAAKGAGGKRDFQSFSGLLRPFWLLPRRFFFIFPGGGGGGP